ncbi:MAG: lysylphosphatidylglycerol synthase transmembrane domain-containing protein [Halioglobus sp.]
MSTVSVTSRKWLFLLLRIAVVVVIYYLIFRKVPLQNVTPLIAPALLGAIAIAVALNIAQAMLCTLRWRLVARKAANVPSYFKSFAAYMEGLLFNQALPSFIGGDAVRVLRWRASQVSTTDAFISVLRDRLFGAIGAASFTLIACALLWQQPIEHYKIVSLIILGSAVTFGCLALLSVSQWATLSNMLLRFKRIHTISLAFVERPLARNTISQSLIISLAAQLLPGISVYVLALALAIQISLPLATAVTGAILLISMIPISLAGWGVREASFLILLVPLGAESEKVLVLGICFGLAGLFSALLGGISIMLGLTNPAPTVIQTHH